MKKIIVIIACILLFLSCGKKKNIKTINLDPEADSESYMPSKRWW